VLYKTSSHVARLQASADPDTLAEGSKERERAMNELDKARIFLPKEILSQLPGESYFRGDSLLDDHFNLSGKMEVLDDLLRDIATVQGEL